MEVQSNESDVQSDESDVHVNRDKPWIMQVTELFEDVKVGSCANIFVCSCGHVSL